MKKLNDTNKEIRKEELKRIEIINKKIKQLYKKSQGDETISRDIVKRAEVIKNRDRTTSIYFKYTKDDNGSLSKPVLIFKSGKKGNLVYSKNNSTGTKKAIQQFKKMIEDIPTHTKTIKEINYDEEEELNWDHYQLVDINTKFTSIHGLTAEENRDKGGVLNPPESIEPQSRIGDNGAL